MLPPGQHHQTFRHQRPDGILPRRGLARQLCRPRLGFCRGEGCPRPLLLQSGQHQRQQGRGDFEDLTPQEAQALAGHDLYLPLDLLPELTGNQFYFHEVTGFKVIDVEKGEIGIIQSIIEYPAQPLFSIMNGDKEILIPVIDPIIKKVDREQRTITIEAPNGLIDLYLES